MRLTSFKTQGRSTWTKRPSDCRSTNVLVCDSVDVCGLLVLREELYKDLFTKKKLLNERKKDLLYKEKELAVLNKIIAHRKKTRSSSRGKDLSLSRAKLETSIVQNFAENAIKLEDNPTSTSPEGPSTFKLPVFILPHNSTEKVLLLE